MLKSAYFFIANTSKVESNKIIVMSTVSQENLKESEISQDKNDQQLFQDSQGCSRKLTQ